MLSLEFLTGEDSILKDLKEHRPDTSIKVPHLR
jgi:hypothetical protein